MEESAWSTNKKLRFEFWKAEDTSKNHPDLHCALGVPKFSKDMMFCKFKEEDMLSTFAETVVKYDKAMGDMWCSQIINQANELGPGDTVFCNLHNCKMPLQPFFEHHNEIITQQQNKYAYEQNKYEQKYSKKISSAK